MKKSFVGIAIFIVYMFVLIMIKDWLGFEPMVMGMLAVIIWNQKVGGSDE